MKIILYLLLVCLCVLFLGSCHAEGESFEPQHYVEIYSKEFFEGMMNKVNLTSTCNSVAGFVFLHKYIGSINSKDNCINVYQDEDCSGDFITLKPGNPFHDALTMWNGVHTRIKAIGHCHDACHETKIERSVETATVDLFVKKDFKGLNEKITVRQRTCSVLSEYMRGVIMSLKVSPSVCIELHEFANCTGTFRDFPVGSPSHNNLKHWDWWETIRVGSVTLCGYHCHPDDNDNDTTISFITNNLTTVKPNAFNVTRETERIMMAEKAGSSSRVIMKHTHILISISLQLRIIQHFT